MKHTIERERHFELYLQRKKIVDELWEKEQFLEKIDQELYIYEKKNYS